MLVDSFEKAMTFLIREISGWQRVVRLERRHTTEGTQGKFRFKHQPDTLDWFQWLDSNSTNFFTIREESDWGASDLCTARKDRSGVWSLHTEIDGQEFQLQLGASEEITTDRLLSAINRLFELPYQTSQSDST